MGPLLFIIYITPLKYIFFRYPSIHYHLYADDFQIYLSFAPNTDPSLHISALKNYIWKIVNWFSSNYLSLKTSKTPSYSLKLLLSIISLTKSNLYISLCLIQYLGPVSHLTIPYLCICHYIDSITWHSSTYPSYPFTEFS